MQARIPTPTGPISIKKSKLGELYETGGLFRAIHLVSIKKSKLVGQLAIRRNFEPSKSADPTIIVERAKSANPTSLLVVRLADFAGSNSNGWPTGPVSIEKSNLGEVYETGGLFRAIHLVSASWPSVGTSSPQNRPVPLDSSRKLTNSSLREQGTFFYVPGRKSLPKC